MWKGGEDDLLFFFLGGDAKLVKVVGVGGGFGMMDGLFEEAEKVGLYLWYTFRCGKSEV